ncbi:uncharacterized protein LOC109713034 isoform X2 [Ananas comosus]|uniref:Uncharacterized protein LOC109713034 isoform X2 n=1 Tax=Ananas comosus TaxID=4615 RepID=A0A6P5FH46_ANACO|nr:uncharacterized protein LOC109713034 isoform X2 [Ananas comosus]
MLAFNLLNSPRTIKTPSSSSSSLPPTQTYFFVSCALSSPSPPSSREEAISQARTSLSTTLQKPLNNPLPSLPTRKLKKQKQPRFRVEIPLLDDSPSSLAQLAAELFSDVLIIKKGSKPPCILILWPSPALLQCAHQVFDAMPSSVVNSDVASVIPEQLGPADFVVFSAPERTQLEEIRAITNALYPKPAILFNPKWAFEEEKDFGGGLGSFVGSFDVVYSFMGLEVRGILSKRKGVVLRFVKDGVLSGEGWVVMVEEEGEQKKKGEMRVVSRFKKRPSIGEVESVLYNLMAANSPVTKSVKFLRDLASNAVTGKKPKQMKLLKELLNSSQLSVKLLRAVCSHISP